MIELWPTNFTLNCCLPTLYAMLYRNLKKICISLQLLCKIGLLKRQWFAPHLSSFSCWQRFRQAQWNTLVIIHPCWESKNGVTENPNFGYDLYTTKGRNLFPVRSQDMSPPTFSGTGCGIPTSFPCNPEALYVVLTQTLWRLPFFLLPSPYRPQTPPLPDYGTVRQGTLPQIWWNEWRTRGTASGCSRLKQHSSQLCNAKGLAQWS